MVTDSHGQASRPTEHHILPFQTSRPQAAAAQAYHQDYPGATRPWIGHLDPGRGAFCYYPQNSKCMNMKGCFSEVVCQHIQSL